jgi:hypothetical protein
MATITMEQTATMASAVATASTKEAAPVATASTKETATMAPAATKEAAVASAVATASRTGAANVTASPAGAARTASAAVCGHLGAGTQRHDENDTVHAEYLLRTEKVNQPMLLEKHSIAWSCLTPCGLERNGLDKLPA